MPVYPLGEANNDQVKFNSATSIWERVAGTSEELPVGTVDNTTLRWDAALADWVENTNFLASAAGAVVVGGTLSVTGAASLEDTLAVVAAVSFEDTLSVTGAATFEDVLGVTGAVTLESTLDVVDLARALTFFADGDQGAGIAGTTGLTNVVDAADDTAAVLGNWRVNGSAGVFHGWLKVWDGTTYASVPMWVAA